MKLKKLTLVIVIAITVLCCTACGSKLESYKSMDKEEITLSYALDNPKKDILSFEAPKNAVYTDPEDLKQNTSLETIKQAAEKNGYGPERIYFDLYEDENKILVQISLYKNSDDKNLDKSVTINGKELLYGPNSLDKKVLDGKYKLSNGYTFSVSISNSGLKNYTNSAITNENIELLKEIVETVKEK